MTFPELCQALDMPPRQVRYLISEGLMPGASSTGRAAAKDGGYGESHLAAGREFKRLLDDGLSVKAILSLKRSGRASLLQDQPVEVRVVDANALAEADDEAFAVLLRLIEDALRKAREDARNQGGE